MFAFLMWIKEFVAERMGYDLGPFRFLFSIFVGGALVKRTAPHHTGEVEAGGSVSSLRGYQMPRKFKAKLCYVMRPQQ